MQTSYATTPAIGVEGQRIDSFPDGQRTGVAEGGAIKVGKVVTMDSTAGRGDKSIRAPAASADVTGPAAYGVSMWDPSYPFDGGDYKQYAALPCMRKGTILLKSETAQAKGTNPFVRYATGTGTVLGSIRNDADTATAVAATWIKVLTPCLANELCFCEINLA